MTLIVTSITVAQAATIINAFIMLVSFAISLSLIVLLVRFLPTTTTAIAWSSISRTLHSSLWPTVLRADSGSGKTEGSVVSTLTHLGTMTTILVAVAGIILPLGLSEGPITHGNSRLLEGTYIPDDSPLALSTTPNQGSFIYGRQCGSTCPGNDNPNTTTIAPSVVEIFNSTPHGPFTMKFRRFFQGDEQTNYSVGFEASADIFFLQNSTFFADGLLIDMTTESPGIGLWNQTIPTEAKIGGTWSQDILWIEPETECVNTNLTADYFLTNGPNLGPDEFNLTDHGGFYNLTDKLPSFDHDGQNINLRHRAFNGAVYSNLSSMRFLNVTRNSSFDGSTYHFSSNSSFNTELNTIDLTKISVLRLSYLDDTEESNAEAICQGFGPTDTANITNVHVNCGIFLGPPLRTDGGDPRVFDRGSKWAQGIHACASATRVSVQTITFSSNSSTNMQGLQITREKNRLNVLWATEKTDLQVGDVDLFWGRVDDRYENHSSLWTTRSHRFYLLAGTSSTSIFLSRGMPASAHMPVWGSVYTGVFNHVSSADSTSQDYSGRFDYAVRAKLQNLVVSDPIRGNAHIRNLVFVDVMANNIIGTQINHTLWVADRLRTLSYDLKYAIPGFLLLAIGIPSFLLAAFFCFTRAVSFEHMKKVLNHTSIGRVVVGASALRVQRQSGNEAPYTQVPNHDYDDAPMGDTGKSRGVSGRQHDKGGWANTAGKTAVTLDLNSSVSSSKPIVDENSKLMETRSSHV